MSTRVTDVMALLKEQLPPELPDDPNPITGEEAIGRVSYLGLLAPVGSGVFARDLLKAVPTLTLFAAATEAAGEATLGSGLGSRISDLRTKTLAGLGSRVTVLFGDVPMVLERVAGRHFDLVMLEEECLRARRMVEPILRPDGLLLWQEKGVWWCQE